jgi:hypothetical protein
LIEYLKGEPLPLPVVAPATAEAGAQRGFLVRDGFEHGVAFLRGSDERVLRLSWEPETKSADARRALPAGRYRVFGYRVVEKDAHGATWHLSTTSDKPLSTIDVRAGEETALALARDVRITQAIRPGQIGVGVFAGGGSGVSIYKDGRRIPLAYRLTDADGAELASGAIRYG